MAEVGSNVHVSGSVTGNFHFCWNISKFSSLNFKVGAITQSKIFQIQPFPPKWYVSLCPGGDSASHDGFVSCHLNRFIENNDDRHECMFTKVNSFRFLNSFGKILWTYSTETSFVSAGCSRIMERDALIHELVGDRLIITVNVTHCTISFVNGTEAHYKAGCTPIAKLVQDFESLSTNAEYADCALSVGDQKIPVQSVILGARSKVFEAMFRNLTIEKKRLCVEISDFSEDIVDSFVQFIYTGNVKKMDVEKALELLRASEKLQISDLKYYCSNYLSSHINVGNAAKMLDTADTYILAGLRSQAMEYLKRM